MAKQNQISPVAPVIALVLAYLVPGAGHIYLGRMKRGLILGITIGALFWSGVAVGGVMTVDPERERWWFAAEMLTGIHGIVGWYRQQDYNSRALRRAEEKGLGPASPQGQAYMDAQLKKDRVALVAPADTVARAYAGVAGLLNLMCLFDALMLGLMGQFGEPPPKLDPAPRTKGRTP